MQTDQNKRLLKLQTTPSAWKMYSSRKADPKFVAYGAKIFKRDQYRCQFCGFRAKLFQEVINLDNDYRNNRQNNMVTACCFCAQCFFVESVGVGGYGGGSLIYLPEINQADLNSLCHVLFCAITNDTGYKSSAQDIHRGLKTRAKSVEDKYGEGTSDPAIMGQLMIDSGQASTDTMDKIFHDLRLLPSRAKFRKQIESWAATALEEMIDK
ncbi:MAG: type IV secretion protein IcmJ [Legionellales bacterium RIFCSPHIGHO2_12_FULL_42_9]|nr:MAG: type IV secretion protein IcmJ [Legionellales bacterium RIFCSPHIGHO2_12_FULL_42_9]